MPERLRKTLSPVGQAVLDGLSRSPKSLPPFLFYDAAGSALFEQITALPEYYLTRTERAILEDSADEMVRAAGENLTVIELGAGTAAKTGTLLQAVLRRQRKVIFRPLDISASAIEIACARLAAMPGVEVRPMVGDFHHAMPRLRQVRGRKLVLYIGSSIGNYDPVAARALLRNLRNHLDPGDALLLGADRVKPQRILLRAYDDASGVTAAFNKNMLAHLNRELDADFRLDRFRHRAVWNGRESRIEMHLESLRAQPVRIAALDWTVEFARGERLHTENSYKFTGEAIEALLRDSGFTPEGCWSDAREWFSLHLARALPANSAGGHRLRDGRRDGVAL